MARRSASGPDLFSKRRRQVLTDRHASLMAQGEAASSAVMAADNELEPYQMAFGQAHAELLRLHQERANGKEIDKDTMLDHYDARMQAGVERHPYRQRLQDAQRWQEAVYRELRDVEAALTRVDALD